MPRHSLLIATGLLIATLVTGGANLWATYDQVGSLRHSVLTQCKFDADLGTAPVAVNPATGKPSLLGIKIVSDSRVAWHGLGCPGTLGPPAPSFARWAAYYHLPVG